MDCLTPYHIPFEVIILDDGSTDATARCISQLHNASPGSIRLLSHAVNRGIAQTYQDLYNAARMDYVVDFAADGQIDPAVLNRMLPLVPQFDIVICHRIESRYGWRRAIVSFCFRRLPQLLFGTDPIDPGCTKLQKREILQIPLLSKGVFREAERVIRANKNGYRLGSIDITARETGNGGGGKISLIFEAVYDMLRLFLRLVVLPRIVPYTARTP